MVDNTPRAGGPQRDLIGYGRRRPRVVWPNGAAVALSPVVAVEEGSEYGATWGDSRNEAIGEIAYSLEPEYRDFGTESVYEYGPRAGVWRLLRFLEEYSLRVTFYVSGAALEKNPVIGEAIAAAGHEPHGHGYRFVEHWRLTREEERDHIAKAVAAIEATCGTRPVGWYARYSPSMHTRELLVEEGGFLYGSMAYNDDYPYFVHVNDVRHLVVPYNALPYNDIRYVLAPGHGSPADYVDTMKRALDEYRREGQAGYPSIMSMGLHARYSGQLGRLSGVRQFFEYALECGDVWIAQRREIARWWLEHSHEFVQS